jgi:hypothetical protein
MSKILMFMMFAGFVYGAYHIYRFIASYGLFEFGVWVFAFISFVGLGGYVIAVRRHIDG